jgi:AcrR family transcriptional regulator
VKTDGVASAKFARHTASRRVDDNQLSSIQGKVAKFMAGIQSKHHGDRRQKILDTAANLFASQGFNKTSVSQISSACNASKAWVYHYFETKDDMLFALLDDFLQKFHERVFDATNNENKEPAEHLRAFILSSLRIYDEFRINYPILYKEAIFLPQQQQDILRIREKEIVDRLESILQKLRPRGIAPKRNKRAITLLVFGTINWTYTWFDPDGRMSVDKLSDLIGDLLINGLMGLDSE